MNSKKFISLILSISMVFSVLSISVSATNVDSDNGIIMVNNSAEGAMSSEETARYNQFILDLPTTSVPTTEKILEYCTFKGSETIGGEIYTSYSSDTLTQHLKDCLEITDITVVSGTIYISYITNDSKTVCITYTESGIVNQTIYDEVTDTAYFLSPSSNQKCTNFRSGTYYTLSETLESKIQACIESGDYSDLQDNPSIKIETDETGLITITPQIASSPMSRAVNGFTNEAAMLDDLKANFPYINNARQATSSMYCQSLKKNVTVIGKELRNAYTRKTVDYKPFAASTGIEVIKAFLGVKTIGIAASILSTAGVALLVVSGVQVIRDAITLYRSAQYNYHCERHGEVYDTTRFNDYVNVVRYFGTGTYVGGYNSSGNFDWVMAPSSTAEDHTWSSIQSEALSRYDSDIYIWGYCNSYYPL